MLYTLVIIFVLPINDLYNSYITIYNGTILLCHTCKIMSLIWNFSTLQRDTRRKWKPYLFKCFLCQIQLRTFKRKYSNFVAKQKFPLLNLNKISLNRISLRVFYKTVFRSCILLLRMFAPFSKCYDFDSCMCDPCFDCSAFLASRSNANP